MATGVPRLRTMEDLMLDGKRVIVRVDFNVTAGADGIVDSTEDYRIEAALPTIHELRQRRCKVLLLAHLGRPGEEDGLLTMDPIKTRLEKLLQESVRMLPKLYGQQVDSIIQGMEQGDVALFPNVRMDDREMKNNDHFADELASVGDVYINEAFSVCHREHASIALLPKKMPSAAGRRTMLEVNALSRLKHNVAHPYVAITSGAKITTKIGVLEFLLSTVDTLCVGGKIANVFLVAQGKWENVDFTPSEIETAKHLLDAYGDRIVLPVDVVVGNEDGTDARVVDIVSSGVLSGAVWDIGPKSVERIANMCSGASVVAWNGPVGRYEVNAYGEGTRELANKLSELSAYRVIGGGDTVTMLEKMKLVQKFDHVSIGGGAMIEFLEGNRMPGLEVLAA